MAKVNIRHNTRRSSQKTRNETLALLSRAREAAAKLPRPAGGKTPLAPAASIVVGVIRQDVLKRLDRSLSRRIHIPGPRGRLSLPGIREHAFVKAPGKRPIDISGEKTRNTVLPKRVLREDEHIFIHSHPTRPLPSLIDLSLFVKRVMSNRKVSDVIYVMDSQRAEAAFNRGVSRKLYYRGPEGRLVPKKILRAAAEQAIWTEATRAVEQINAVARVVITPTETLLKMPPKQARALAAFLERKSKISRRVEAESFGTFTDKAEKQIARAWGRLFKLKYDSMPGYRFDGKAKSYVKI